MIRSSFIYLFLFLVGFLPTHAAVTGYMKLGDIKGESQAADHEEEIDIHGISWGIVRPLDRTYSKSRWLSVKCA
jgi:type VI secretion system secreted protein Hcp